MSMNRQLRRAQEKQDKKLEREKEERRAERRRRLDQLRAQRQRRREETLAKAQSGKSRDGGTREAVAEGKAQAPAAPGRNDPGRFSGALAIATVVFIIMQAVIPTDPEAVFDSVIKAGFYLMLGYFLSLWLMRRNQPNALLLTALAGVILLTGTWLGFLLRPDSVVDGLSMLLALPMLAIGIFLARFVFNLARSQNPG